MPFVEAPITWLWLVRGIDLPPIPMTPGVRSLVTLNDYLRTIQLVGFSPLRVQVFKLETRAGATPNVTDHLVQHIYKMWEQVRACNFEDPHLYGVFKSKGRFGGVSSGAEGNPLVDALEVGVFCASGPIVLPNGLVHLNQMRLKHLTLPPSVQVEVCQPQAPRVSRYERKWVI